MELSTIKDYAQLSIDGCNDELQIGDIVNENYILIDSYSNEDNGYSGYAYKNILTNEIIVINEGSYDPRKIENIDDLIDIYNDWIKTNFFNIGVQGKTPSQLLSADYFLSRVIDNNKDNFKIIGVGQSLGGGLSQALGMLEKYKDIEFYCYNPPGMEHIKNDLSTKFELSDDTSNINNIISQNEPLSKIYNQVGNNYVAINGDSGNYIVNHFVNIHIDNDLIYKVVEQPQNIENTILETINKITDKYKLIVKVTKARIEFTCYLNETYSYEELKEIANELNKKGLLERKIFIAQISMDNQLYTIQPGDTLWALCQRYGLTTEEMLELNPWLSDRFSDDGTFALIRPGEQVLLPGGSSEMAQKIREPFTEAQSAEVPRDPLLIDLDGDGIETTSVENGVYFDQENDGFAEVSAWVSSDDGVLAIDKNNNGTIDNGSELFGDSYVKSDGTIATSGFDALSDLDSNGDGQINSSDTSFDAIKILKGDGTLLSLSDAGISSISLTAKKSVITDSNGNRQLTTGTYTKTDGSTGKISDYELQSDPMNSIATDWLEVSDEIAALPDIPGMGKMYSLHQAMARDEELTALIKTFVNAPDANTRQSLIPQIIYKWADVENIASDSRGIQMDAKDLTALEKFMGSEFLGVAHSGIPNSTAANLLENAFAILKSYIYAELTSQTALKPIYEMLELEYDEALQKYVYNLDTVQNYIDSVISQDTTSGKGLLLEFAGTFINLGLKETSNYSSFEQHYIEMGDDFKLLMQTVDKINIYGTEGDDNIEGTAQQEAVFGYGGNDTIYTRQGDDLVYGGDGNDIIDTCEGNDVIYGEAGDDTINSGAGDDIVYGGDGNDIITNSGGNDYIDGGAGDDTIKSTAISSNPTDETLVGGTGNDYFEDKDGGDETFIFNLGDGNDLIYNRGGNDTIKFGAGITQDNIKFHGEGYDLFITFSNSEDSIKIKSFISSNSYRIENFEFSDGTIITSDYVMSHLVTDGTSGDDTLEGTTVSETIYGYAGNDTIESGSGDDIVYGGDGNDTITNFGGNDYIDGGAGDDTIKSTASTSNPTNETLVGGTGNDYFEDKDGGDETFIFNIGDGNDLIYNRGGNDTIKFGAGITLDNIKFHGVESDLFITFKDTTDSIKVKSFINSSSYRIENFEFSDGTIITSDYVMSHLVTEGTPESDTLEGTNASETIYGYAGNDTINSGSGDDIVYGGDGNDIITNSGGDDYIDGGAGDDTIKSTASTSNPTDETLVGGLGNDYFEDKDGGDETFIFNLGDGNDVIHNRGGNDTIKFGAGITLDNIKFHGEGVDLFITFSNSEDSIQIKSFINSSSYRIENFEFSDGTTITSDYVMSNLVTEGTPDDDTIIGTNASETIYGYAGNDTINSGAGDDIVYGGDGNDIITNSGGDDYIDGGAGDDTIKSTASTSNPTNETLVGGTGNDYFEDKDGGDETFIFNLGDGNDLIYNRGGNDTIKFGAGITQENTKFHGEGSDLFITFKDTTDSIQIKSFVNSSSYRIENFEFSDGTLLTSDYVMSHLVTEGTSGDDTITGTNASETIYGYAGNDTINSGSGDDIVYGGDGNDIITNSGGDDYIDGGAGDDIIKSTASTSNPTDETLVGGTGNDYFEDKDAGDETFIFNIGDGNDVIYNRGGNDTIVFESSVSKENIAFFMDSSGDLFVDYGEDAGNDIIQIENQKSSSYAIESFKVTDESGKSYLLTSDDINKLIQDMSAYAADNGISINSAADVKENPDLMNLVANSWAA